MPPLYFTKKKQDTARPVELHVRAVDSVWKRVAKRHGGEHASISGALHEAGKYNIRDLGWTTMREFYRGLMTGQLNDIFGCDLRVQHSGKSEELIRQRGSWFWLEGIQHQMARPQGIVITSDGGTRRPHDGLVTILGESYQKESQMLKIGFHRLCQSDLLLKKREQWKREDMQEVGRESDASTTEPSATSVVGQPTVDVVVGIPVAKSVPTAVEKPAEKPTVAAPPQANDCPKPFAYRPAQPKDSSKCARVRRRPKIPGDPLEGSFHRELVEAWRDFKHQARTGNRDEMFVEGVALGPTMDGYKMTGKKRKTGNDTVDFYIVANDGTLLRSEQDVWRHFS